MEINKAIERLKEYYDNSVIFSETVGEEVDSFTEALQMAISALEKQIPEPPKVAEGNDADGIWRPDMFFCPTCGKVIDTCEHHCICGQKIDWEG